MLFPTEMDFVKDCGVVEVPMRDLVPWKLLRMPGGMPWNCALKKSTVVSGSVG